MKKTLVLILVILGLIGCSAASAEMQHMALTSIETWDTLTEGEDGLVRDPQGIVYGATKARDAWIEKMHNQGYSATAVAYRPLTIRSGVVRSDVTGLIIGYTTGYAGYVGELGDSWTETAAAGALGALALGGMIAAERKRRCLCR